MQLRQFLTIFSLAKMSQEKSPKWTTKPPCDGQKELERALKAGEIDPAEQPKEVWARNPIFRKYKPATFRLNLGKTRAFLGLHCMIHTIYAAIGLILLYSARH
jgi:hypothetical protein